MVLVARGAIGSAEDDGLSFEQLSGLLWTIREFEHLTRVEPPQCRGAGVEGDIARKGVLTVCVVGSGEGETQRPRKRAAILTIEGCDVAMILPNGSLGIHLHRGETTPAGIVRPLVT